MTFDEIDKIYQALIYQKTEYLFKLYDIEAKLTNIKPERDRIYQEEIAGQENLFEERLY